VLLGVVDRLLETGANDVLVVRPCAGSIDQRERLLPYLPDDVVMAVDLAAGRMQVRWYLDV
jgi:16S rRNA processing protein RimM